MYFSKGTVQDCSSRSCLSVFLQGLDPAAQQALTEQATKIATSKGFMPVLLHPFKFQADGPVHRLPVYAGQSVEVAVCKS